MRPKDPPTLATWMLEHLTFGPKNEALAGDLLEEFRGGRTAAWYWRQVLMAIVVGFVGEVPTQWPAIVYATLWAIPVPAYSILVVPSIVTSPLFSWRWQLEWPYSTICDVVLHIGTQLIYVWFALIIYFLLFSLATRRANLRRFAQSLWQSAFVFIAVSVGLLAFFALLPRHSGNGVNYLVPSIPLLRLVTLSPFLELRLPFFFTLFLSIWMTQSPNHKSSPRNAAT